MSTLCNDCKNRKKCEGPMTVKVVSACSDYKKEGESMETFKRIMTAISEGLAESAKKYDEIQHPEIGLGLKTEVTLDAEALKNLAAMNQWQLEAIFKGKIVHLADDPAVYRELRRFNQWQLEAIFGKEE